MAAGWIWTIPLFGRNGNGYVYSDEFCTPEEAERTLREHVAPGQDDLEANHIRMRIGRNDRSWVKQLRRDRPVQRLRRAAGVHRDLLHPARRSSSWSSTSRTSAGTRRCADAYNRRVAHVVDGVKEFLVLHYRAAARDDTPYWKEAKARELPEGLAERLRAGLVACCSTITTIYPHYHGFETYSWITMLLGLGWQPERPRPALAHLDPANARAELAAVRRDARRLVDGLPTVREYLVSLNEKER